MEKIQELDGNILLWIQENLRNDFLDPIMKGITRLGDSGIIWIGLTVILLLFAKTRRMGAACAMSLILNAIIVNVFLKNIVGRTRPYEVVEGLERLIPAESSYSFPSGHATHAFAVGVVLFALLPRKYGVPIIVLSALIAISRMYVGVHYPTDVIFGCLIGTVVAIFSIMLTKKILDKRHEMDEALQDEEQ